MEFSVVEFSLSGVVCLSGVFKEKPQLSFSVPQAGVKLSFLFCEENNVTSKE